MWIKTKDGRFLDASGCAIVPNQAKTELHLHPHGAKAAFPVVDGLSEAEMTRLQNKIEACLIDRRPLVDLS